MSQASVARQTGAAGVQAAPALFALAIFTSAALVFMVEPMIAKLVLPKLGGSPAVWNTSMVFFQLALLLGYGYAHLIQRVKSLHRQIVVHLCLLVAAAITLPLRVNGLLGDPPTGLPIPWLLGELTLSIGAPFAVLSATAPLLQAWYARVRAGHDDAKNPYVLYAASNLGSFISLLAYPAVIEPLLRLTTQRYLWTGGYLLFVVIVAALGFISWRARDEAPSEPLPASAPIPWREKLIWVLLAAVPASLMLGVTLHLSVDIASAPFLWVVPLALYLLTFVLAFQDKPILPLSVTLLIQAGFICACIATLPFATAPWIVMFGVNLLAFFFTALMCHQTLAARRPPPDRLTEFYLWLAVGGVVGGAFNALIAPLIFNTVREYPLVLLLATLARPWPIKRPKAFDWVWFAVAVVFAFICWGLVAWMRVDDTVRDWIGAVANVEPIDILYYVLGFGAAAAFVARRNIFLFFAALTSLWLGAQNVAGRYDWVHSERSFFGVIRAATFPAVGFGPKGIMTLMNGSTLHGGEAIEGKWLCYPLLYYAPSTSLGQSIAMVQARSPNLDMGVVGLGSGTVATYKRAGDNLTYFEIDPKVLHFAFNPKYFSYVTRCAHGPVRLVMGDARLSLAKQPANKFDYLLVDAFSSDSVPTHLLTEEALRGYLRVLKPNGVVVLHLSNRNLELDTAAVATARAIKAPVMMQVYWDKPGALYGWSSSTDAVIVGKTPQALADFAKDKRWIAPPPSTTRPWTDDYTNLIGALYRRMRQKANGEG